MANARRTFSIAVVLKEEGFQAEGVTRFLLTTAVVQQCVSDFARVRRRHSPPASMPILSSAWNASVSNATSFSTEGWYT